MNRSRSLCRLLSTMFATALLCSGCAGAAQPATPSVQPTVSAVPTEDSQPFQASVVAAVSATSSAVALSPTPSEPAPIFADLVPFRHQPTDLVGLMSADWTLTDTADGFAIRPPAGGQASFTVTLTDTGKLPVGKAEHLTKALFDSLRQPELIITEDHIAPDGSGRLTLIGDPGLTTYAWAKQIDRGLLTMLLIVPTEQDRLERTAIEKMLASVELSGDSLTSVPCRHGFSQTQITAEDAWFLSQEQRGDLFDPITWYDSSVGFAAGSVGDFDGDGRQDLALMTNSLDEGDQLDILLQNPDGTLGAPTCFSIAWPPKAMATGDLNGDGRDDVVLGGLSPELDLLLSAEQGLFGMRRSLTLDADSVRLLMVADMNGDGHDDVAAIPRSKPAADLFLQQENGELAPLISFPINRTSVDVMAMADLNGDGLPDLIQHSAQQDPDLQVFLQQSDHSFSSGVEYRSSYRSKSMAVGDVTGDGRNDVVLSVDNNVEGARLLIFEQGDGDVLLERASYPAYRQPDAVVIADFDGDGHNDVAVFHADEQVLSVLLQQDDGTLSAGKLYFNISILADPQVVSVGDLNSDGRADIVAAGRGFSIFYGRAP